MAAALLAVLPLAQWCLLERGDILGTAPGFQSVNALTGPPDHDRHDRQWQ
jgi:hypothetical protein